MAKKFTNTGSINNIATGKTIQSGHVTQSVMAFTGEEEYDVTISGSLAITGSIFNVQMDPSPSPTSAYKTVVVNPTTGQFLTTGSYGGAGGSSNTSTTPGHM